MKIKGFTLGEVLITIAILGVVSALTIPTFTASVHNQTNASRLAPITSDLENVFGLMMLREDKDDVYETELLRGIIASDSSTVSTALEKYTKVTKIGGAASNYGYAIGSGNQSGFFIPAAFAIDPVVNPLGINWIKIKEINGESMDMRVELIYSTPGGANILWNAAPAANTRRIYIDVNGGNNSNVAGRDIFAFVLGHDGHLYPFGTRQAAELQNISNPQTQVWDSSNAGDDYRCTGSNYVGWGCTARLIEHNYKVDY